MIYDIKKTWLDNLKNPPTLKDIEVFDNNKLNKPTKYTTKYTTKSEQYNFLGYKVNSPIGIAAGPLLNSDWIKFATEIEGFDVLTYKTIRTQNYDGHPLPNIVYLNDDLNISETPTTTITNSFGMPSMTQEYLSNDIIKAIQFCNQSGKVLVVSITGSSLQDFINNAKFVKSLNVPIVEANLSCPNILGNNKSNDIYLNTHVIFNYVYEIKRVLGDTPLIIKVGYYTNPFIQEYALQQIYKGGAQAVCGINSMKCEITGFPRAISGVCGKHIKEYAIEFIRSSRKIIDNNKLNLQLLGVGGIITKDDVDDFFRAGADWVQCATGFMNDPNFLSK